MSIYAKVLAEGAVLPINSSRNFPSADRTSVMTSVSDVANSKPFIADADLLRCPKCSDRMVPHMLDITDAGNQNVWWTCAGVDKIKSNGNKKCSFPLYIPSDVFWVTRSRFDIQQGIVPRPNIRNLPKKYHHLYPKTFATSPAMSSGRNSVADSRIRTARSDGMSVTSSDDNRSNASKKSLILAKKRTSLFSYGGTHAKRNMAVQSANIIHLTGSQSVGDSIASPRSVVDPSQPLVETVPTTSRIPEQSSASTVSTVSDDRTLASMGQLHEDGRNFVSRSPSPIGFHDDSSLIYKSENYFGKSISPEEVKGDPRGIRAICGIAGPELSSTAANIMDKFKANDQLLNVYPARPDVSRLKATMSFEADEMAAHAESQSLKEECKVMLDTVKKAKESVKKQFSHVECADVVDLCEVLYSAHRMKEKMTRGRNLNDPLDKTRILFEMKNSSPVSNFPTFGSVLNQRSFNAIDSISSVEAWNRRNHLQSLIDKKKNCLSLIRSKRLEMYAQRKENAKKISMPPIPIVVPPTESAPFGESDVCRDSEQHIEKEVSALLAAKLRKYKKERLRKSQVQKTPQLLDITQSTVTSTPQQSYEPVQMNMPQQPSVQTDQSYFDEMFGTGDFYAQPGPVHDWSVAPNQLSPTADTPSEDDASARMRELDAEIAALDHGDIDWSAYDFDLDQ